MTYFDSCYLAKLYLLEPDSPRVRSHATAVGEITCCAIGWTEVISTFHRHLRDGRLTQRQFRLLSEQVALDLRNGLWKPIPVTIAILEAQARRMVALPGTVFLRSADALHLTCAAEAGLAEIFSSDRHLIAAAAHFGLRAVTL